VIVEVRWLVLVEKIFVVEGKLSDHQNDQKDDNRRHDNAKTDDNVDSSHVSQHVVKFRQALPIVVREIP
jgi:hypothetical protein